MVIYRGLFYNTGPWCQSLENEKVNPIRIRWRKEKGEKVVSFG
jgi:hypothetical protein